MGKLIFIDVDRICDFKFIFSNFLLKEFCFCIMLRLVLIGKVVIFEFELDCNKVLFREVERCCRIIGIFKVIALV